VRARAFTVHRERGAAQKPCGSAPSMCAQGMARVLLVFRRQSPLQPLDERKAMKKLIHAWSAAALLLLSTAGAVAQTKAEPEFTFTGNAGLFSDYRFRGYTQTGYGPAFQGGFDLAHKSGFYLGNWNSNVEQKLYTGASLEMDFYGGYKGSVGDFGYDVGYLYYHYPNSGALGSVKIKNGELYVGGSFGPLSAKWYYATTKFFSIGQGVPGVDTKGSWYLDLAGTLDLGGGWTATAHYGYQRINDGKKAGLLEDRVSDYKLGIAKDVGGWALGVAVVGTSAKNLFTTAESGFAEGGGKTAVVLSVTKSF
jgi:uncharacterized protein (TIGR02001 family)